MRRNAIREVDVAVFGGGPAGTATALALARLGCSAIVIERTYYDTVRIGETLPPAIKNLLAKLGLWERFLEENHSPSFGIHSAWGQSKPYTNDFIFDPYGAGWHVDRARFDAMLARGAEEAGASVCRGSRLLSCTVSSAGNWRIEVASGDRLRRLRAGFVVDATGRASSLVHKQGARRIWFDHLVGVVAFLLRISPAQAPGKFTLIEATKNGWWYSAMLPDSRLVLAYMTDADLYARGLKRSVNYWQEQLTSTTHTQARAAGYALDSAPRVVAANSSHMARVTGNRWLAVGDAAMTFDPLAGQGISIALQSGLRAANAIHVYFSGSDSALDDYEDEVLDGFRNYTLKRSEYYRRENRWPLAPFWRRRLTLSRPFNYSRGLEIVESKFGVERIP